MPPKVKIAKEDIVNAAVELVRQYGPQALNARELAARLCCSTQPIFSNFATMDELRLLAPRIEAHACLRDGRRGRSA